MTLDEIRKQIDEVDTQVKPLFIKRMECAKHVAEAKAKTGGDVFVKEREVEIIKKRAADVPEDIYDEYVTFLKHMMSVSRRYQYGILTNMQETVLEEALQKAGLQREAEHHMVDIRFSCDAQQSDLNLFINMITLNQVNIQCMNLQVVDNMQQITMTLKGNINDSNMKRLLCQIGKEATDFSILELKK